MLSICIPTFNRAPYLQSTLASITSQRAFWESNDIEVIVSDNCSTDNTSQVVNQYAIRFPSQIFYQRNSQNIKDKNFIQALELGNKKFLKLHNDNLPFREGVLEDILQMIDRLEKLRPVIFFLDGNANLDQGLHQFKDSNDFLSVISFYSTWIGGYGVWKEDLCQLAANMNPQFPNLLLMPGLLRLVKSKHEFVVWNKKFIDAIRFKKGGYNEAEVFAHQFLSILKEGVQLGVLTKKSFEKIRKDVFIMHIVPRYFGLADDFVSEKGHFFRYTKDYWFKPYYYIALVSMCFMQLVPQSFRKLVLRKLRDLYLFTTKCRR